MMLQRNMFLLMQISNPVLSWTTQIYIVVKNIFFECQHFASSYFEVFSIQEIKKI